ncbi:class I SAM-dependent methyltransferase [[Eubacterium] cellulosolvens]
MKNQMDDYYNSIAAGYDSLHAEEQREKIEIISEFLQNDSELSLTQDLLLFDVGCGTGLSTMILPCSCAGLDPAVELLKIANQTRLDTKNLTRAHDSDRSSPYSHGIKHLGFIRGIAEALPIKSKSCDIVVAVTSVHNFNDVFLGIAELQRIAIARVAITVLKSASEATVIMETIRKNFQTLGTRDNNFDYIFYLKPKKSD